MKIPLRHAALLAVLLLLLASRRWAQLVSPQVWDEDGTYVIHGLMTSGLVSLLQPVNGYLIAVPKLISAAALGISFSKYPLISTVLAWVLIGFVGIAVASSPTKLRGRALCALAIFLIPSDPEVFGLPLYTLWWSTLLLFILALWDEQKPEPGWRIAFLLLGGLSSPVILLVLPVLYWRAWTYRRRHWEPIIAAVGSAIALVQGILILKDGEAHLPPLKSLLSNTAPAFLGRFLIGNWVDRPGALWFAALAVALGIAVCARQLRREPVFWICLYLLVGTIGLSVIRVDPALIHPRFGGPRYFFFPFILVSWLLTQSIYVAGPAWKRGVVAAIGLGAFANALPAWSRQHDDLHWNLYALSCREFPAYEIPVEYDGHRESAWKFRVSGAQCARLLDRDLLLGRREIESRPTFPYAVFAPGDSDAREGGSVVGATMAGADFSKSHMPGFKVIGSYHVSDADVGEVYVKLRRGDSLRFRSGPAGRGQRITVIGHENDFIQELPLANEWVKLVFSNAALPAEFTVRISDEGRGWGEWCAIAIPDVGR